MQSERVHRSNRKPATAALVAGLFVCLLFVCGGLLAFSIPIGLPTELLMMMIYGWMFYAFVKYREGRQDEVTHLLCTAAEANAPLAPSLWAYLEDRPRGWLREFWTGLIMFFVLPGYYWFWHRGHSYERKVTRVAQFLEMGESLPNALKESPGVVAPGMILAAEIGQRTGRMAECLRSSQPRRLTSIWIELLPRMLYPILLVFFLLNVLIFWSSNILPKMERIYFEFGQELPPATVRVIALETLIVDNIGTLLLGVLIVGALCGVFVSSSRIRWHFPILGRLYRRHQQSVVLKMLAVLLRVDLPAPQAFALLANSSYFPSEVRLRLLEAGLGVQNGEPLAPSMLKSGLLQPSMVGLVQSAVRVQNLPWALDQLGETLGERTVRTLRLVSQVVSPLLVIGVGVLVYLFALGMFLPLIDLITRLSE